MYLAAGGLSPGEKKRKTKNDEEVNDSENELGTRRGGILLECIIDRQSTHLTCVGKSPMAVAVT